MASDALRSASPSVCGGDLVVAASLSEPEAGTALTDLKTRGELQGNHVVLNGQKRWCSGAGHSGGYVVFCRLSDAPKAAGIGAVYVEAGTPGLTFGPQEPLMGCRGIASADIFLDNVTVPRDQIVAEAGQFRRLIEAFNIERCGNAAISVGIASGALDQALAYVQDRRQFGKSLIDFQAVQLKLAEMAMQVDAARLLVRRAANTQFAPDTYETAVAKCFANETVRRVTGDALQLLGAYGYSKAFAMERRFRDAWGWGIAGGTIEIQKVNIVSAMLGRRFDQRA